MFAEPANSGRAAVRAGEENDNSYSLDGNFYLEAGKPKRMLREAQLSETTGRLPSAQIQHESSRERQQANKNTTHKSILHAQKANKDFKHSYYGGNFDYYTKSYRSCYKSTQMSKSRGALVSAGRWLSRRMDIYLFM
ncbi:hypothetical protein EVAR_65791_1 [Eumeta japonica]|uniref:Uncharacterized protein n=1 Tax=Eumeta variegata TaxID=151549 RepID=A0A4C1ZYY2_EUMVA|nr:hypothetical protein EVAR_65791_1 [Eumeta japonica]